MTTVSKIMKELESLGSEQVRKTHASHGAPEGKTFGVRVSDLKKVMKTIKGKQDVALDLFATGNYDAMYLAGMVADGRKMTKSQLDSWARKANLGWISEYTVPWVASESEHGQALALKWIDAKKEHVAAAGWNTYAGLVITTPDEDLDMAEIKALLKRVEQKIDGAPNRVRYTMNGFVIAVGAYVKPLARQAQSTAKKLGKVAVDMGDTACKVPVALETMGKMEKAGRTGKKRKAIRC